MEWKRRGPRSGSHDENVAKLKPLHGKETGVRRLPSLPKRKADFIEPMDCAPVPKLIDGPGWLYEIKLDGYRAVAIKYGDSIDLF